MELKENMFSQPVEGNDLNKDLGGQQGCFRKHRNIILLTTGVVVVAAAVVIVVIVMSSSGEKEPDFSEYYSDKTKKYLNLLKDLESKNLIAYQWNFENSLKNNYDKNSDTSLILNDSSLSVSSILKEEVALKKEDEELVYYAAHNETPKKYYVYGPSDQSPTIRSKQSLYSTKAVINPKKWDGFTLSINLKLFNGTNNIYGRIFGWGSDRYGETGCYIRIDYGEIVYKCGKAENAYDYQDSVKMGYNATLPNTHYLTYRPFLSSNRWHQIIVSIKKVTNEADLPYLKKQIKEVKIGDYVLELFIDGQSRENSTISLYDSYGSLSAFNFSTEEKFTDNKNWYMDNILVFKRGIKQSEAEILYDSIYQNS